MEAGRLQAGCLPERSRCSDLFSFHECSFCLINAIYKSRTRLLAIFYSWHGLIGRARARPVLLLMVIEKSRKCKQRAKVIPANERDGLAE